MSMKGIGHIVLLIILTPFFAILASGYSVTTLVHNESFDRANSPTLGVNWTNYWASGNSNWTLAGNRATHDTITYTWTHYLGYNITGQLGVISLEWQLEDTLDAGETTQFCTYPDEIGDANHACGIRCEVMADFFVCYDGTSEQHLYDMSSHDYSQPILLEIHNISNSSFTYEIRLDNVEYGEFDFLNNSGFHHFYLRGKQNSDADNFTVNNLYFYTSVDIQNVSVYGYTNYDNSTQMAFNITWNNTWFSNVNFGNVNTTLSSGYYDVDARAIDHDPYIGNYYMADRFRIFFNYIINMNLSLRDNVDNSLLDPACSMNGVDFYPQENRIYYNQSQSNYLECDLSGYQNYSTTITAPNQSLNLTMYRASLELNFSSPSRGGFVTDGSTWFEEFSTGVTKLVITPANMTQDSYIYVHFNKDASGNESQFYEYQYDGSTADSEALTVFRTGWFAHPKIYFKILDYQNSIVTDAQLRVYGNTTTGNDYLLFSDYFIGQRYSHTTGTTFFYLPRDAVISLTVSKDGYVPRTIAFTSSKMLEFTYDNPYEIKLQESDDSYLGVYVGTNLRTYNNETTEILGGVYAPDSNTVQIRTSYKGALETLQADQYDRYYFTLENGDDFDNSVGGDLTITVLVDNVVWGTRVIEWVSTDKAVLVSLPTLSFTYLRVIVPIILLLISIVAQSYIKNPNIGFTVYMTSLLIIPLISTRFLYLTVISLIYMLSGFLRNTMEKD